MSETPNPPFKNGDRIKLVRMGPDDPCPVEPGATGTVLGDPVWLQHSWTVTVQWDVPRSLNLVIPPDVAVLLPKETA